MIHRIIATGLIATLSACNTVEGVGRDLAASGEAIEDAASSARRPASEPVYRPAPPPVDQRPLPRSPGIY